MNTTGSLLLALLLVLCAAVPGATAESPAAGISSLPAVTTGPPPQAASAYINETRAAVAEANWTSALVITTRGLAWYPDNADLLCLQGYSYRKMGQYQKSVDTVSRAIPLDPKAVRYANRGYGYLALGNNSAALADAGTGISLDANYTANYAVKALALQGMGKNAEALAAIGTALAQVPDSAHYWHVKGRILADSGDCAAATAALQKSVALDANYVLPYPGFGSAEENLAAVNGTCASRPGQPATSPVKSSPLAVLAILACMVAIGIIKR